LVHAYDAGDHTIFVGQVEDSEVLSDEEPILFDLASEYIQRIKEDCKFRVEFNVYKESEQSKQTPDD